jgi:Domain of unknown function (DUF4912)
MTRDELERLDRDGLVTRAQAAGVTRAGILTRAELVDELLLRSMPDPVGRRRARGFFGIARDLLASAVELGLNLPDAADRIRTLGDVAVVRRSAPSALPTVTLAEIYAAQGHRARAVETLEGVLAREPDHVVARDLVGQLREGTVPVPPQRMAPEPDVEPDEAADDAPDSPAAPVESPPEPSHMLDDAPLPSRYDVDECVALPVDPRKLYVYWEVRSATLEALSAARPGRLVLRLAIFEPTWEGPRSETRDQDVDGPLGDTFAAELPAGCVVRAAIGWKSGDTFASIAHSPALETPAGAPSPFVSDVLVRWTPAGVVPVKPSDPDAASIERALAVARRDETVARLAAMGGFLGSSERWMRRVSVAPRA